MKIQSLAVLAGVSAPLILGGSASGGFLGVECCVKPNPFGLLTVNVYAVFDRPGEDSMTAVAGTPNNHLLIEVIGGMFYQHVFGSDTAPNGAIIAAFPSLAYDTFVTFGVKCVGVPPCQPVDDTILSPGWPGFRVDTLAMTNDAWVVPVNSQGDPFHPDTFPGNGTVLIGQFSTPDGSAIQGTMLMVYTSNGVAEQSVETFFCDVGMVGCSGLGCQSDGQCDDGDPCNGEEVCVDGDCLSSPPDPDCNGNGVLDSCDIANNTSTDADGDGIPDDCEVLCQSDLDNDGEVGIVDFLKLLSDWGMCP